MFYTTEVSKRLRNWHTVILHSKITKITPKCPQINPEIPKSMHLGHIFLLGLAKQFFFTVPLPSPNRGNPPYFKWPFGRCFGVLYLRSFLARLPSKICDHVVAKVDVTIFCPWNNYFTNFWLAIIITIWFGDESEDRRAKYPNIFIFPTHSMNIGEHQVKFWPELSLYI